jgi:hypothetical protein
VTVTVTVTVAEPIDAPRSRLDSPRT